MSTKKPLKAAAAASTEQEKMERIPVVRPLAPVNYKTINQNVAPN